MATKLLWAGDNGGRDNVVRAVVTGNVAAIVGARRSLQSGLLPAARNPGLGFCLGRKTGNFPIGPFRPGHYDGVLAVLLKSDDVARRPLHFFDSLQHG